MTRSCRWLSDTCVRMTDAMLEKVRKLLAKAEDPGCTPAEAAALNDKAAELIAKYGVDRALLAAAGAGVRPGRRPGDHHRSRPTRWTSRACSPRSPGRCAAERAPQGVGWATAYGYAMHLFGFASDLERTELLYTSLLVQAAYGLAAAPVPGWESPAAFRRSWLAGFTYAVGNRLREAERARERPSPDPARPWCWSTGAAGSTPRVAECYPRLRTSGPRRLQGSGVGDGYEAGQRADLGGVGLARRARPSLHG